MGADSFSKVQAVADHLAIPLSPAQQERIRSYHDWLAVEGIRAGGIGPHERNRLWDRHIADSLTFSSAIGDVERCLDIGSGVGLPGMVLAIVFPGVSFVLLDRSGRRCDLMRRSAAIVGIGNVEVVQLDVGRLEGRFEAIVSRAAIPIDKMMIHVKRLLAPGGTCMLGLSRAQNPGSLPSEDPELSFSLVEIPGEILDSGATLLRIGSNLSAGDVNDRQRNGGGDRQPEGRGR